MRKVLSFVLVLSLVLGSFGMAFAATTPSDKALSDIDGLACEDAVRVLTSLDVVSGYEDGTYKPEQTVTRAEMASLIINALGLKETDAVPKFADSKTHWAKGYIAYANTLGIISGRSETVFDPDATVTYDEATTMLIKALGYNDESLNGTYPASYVSRARVLGILDDVQTGSGGANRGDIAVMLYQTLDQAIGKVDKDGNFQATVTKYITGTTNPKEYDTMLARLGASLFDSEGDMDSDDNYYFIVTKGNADNDSLINLYPYIGAKVNAYMNADEDIIAVKDVKSVFLTGEFDGDDTFSVGDTDYDIKITQNSGNGTTEFFENTNHIGSISTITAGALNLDQFSDSDFTETIDYDDSETYTLAVDVSGKSIKDIYSVTYWNVTENDYFATADSDDIKNDHSLFGVDFREDDNGDIDKDAFELIGADSLDDIKTDNVVYVYENSKDNEIVRIAVGTKKVSGEISKINDSSSKFTIAGTVYEKASSDVVAFSTTPKAGDTVTLYLDAYGDIYDYEKGAGEPDNYAVVLDAGQDGTWKSEFKVELLLADGSSKVFAIDDDDEDLPIAVSGGGLKAHTNIFLTAGALIKYDLNKSGDVDEIEDVSMHSVLASANKAVSAKGYFDGHKVNTDAVIFNLSGDDNSDADDYEVLSYNNVLDSDNLTASYVLDGDDIACMLISKFNSGDAVYGIFTGRSTVSGDFKYEYSVLIDGKVDSKLSDEKFDIKQKGAALYQLKFDGSGAMTGSTKLVTTTTTAISTTAIASGLSGDTVTVTIAAVATTGGVFYKDGRTLYMDKAATEKIGTMDSDAVYYKWDDGKYVKGSINDITNVKDRTIVLYDLYDEDGVYDLALIFNK